MNATHQQNSRELATEMRQTLSGLGTAPEYDTEDRSLWRTETMLLGFYDEPDDDEDPGMAVRDLLTDLLHYCRAHDLDLDHELSGAEDMAAQELAEWQDRDLLDPDEREI